MEKFTVFDLLSLLLPGVFLVFILRLLLKYYNLVPFELTDQLSSKLTDFGVSLLFSVVLGGLAYYLADKFKKSFLFKKILKIYTPIGMIIFSMKNVEHNFFEILNKKSIEIFGKKIFLTKDEFKNHHNSDKEELIKLQGRFYSLAYYDLQYCDKIDYPRTYQSFYYFFRQIITSIIILTPVLAYTLIFRYNILITEIRIFFIRKIIIDRFLLYTYTYNLRFDYVCR